MYSGFGIFAWQLMRKPCIAKGSIAQTKALAVPEVQKTVLRRETISEVVGGFAGCGAGCISSCRLAAPHGVPCVLLHLVLNQLLGDFLKALQAAYRS
jgi:hypothetical protein